MKSKLLFGLLSLLLLIPASALADSITPSSFDASLAVGGTATVNKVVTITEDVTTAKVDVFFLTDTTGSMGPFITSVKNSASGILTATAALGDVAFGVGEYRDFYDVFTYRMNTDLTTNQSVAQAGINLYSASGGGDYLEADLYALNQVATGVSWRPDSTRILVWFGDAAGHDPSGGITEATATAALQAANITVQALNTTTSTTYYLDSLGQATRITAATGGTYYSSIDTTAIVTEITNAIVDVFDDYTTVSLGLSSVPAGVSVSVSPASYTGMFDRSVERTFGFNVSFTGLVPGDYSFPIYALVDGGIVATESDRILVTGVVDPIPEPASMLLLGTGLAGLAGIGRNRKRKKNC